MTKLVLIGGAPGVGKSAVLDALLESVDSVACLDADDVRRVRPLEFDDRHGQMGVANVSAVVRGYLAAGHAHVFVGWVFANPDLTRRVVEAVGGGFDELYVLHLVASEEVLARRSQAKIARGLDRDYQRSRVEAIAGLPTPKIDTTMSTPGEVAQRIMELVRSAPAAREG